MQREIKFHPIFGRLLLSGAKTCTSRSKQLADKGDTFSAFGATFLVYNVQQTRLGAVRARLFAEEGAISPEHFEKVYRSVGRYRPFDPEKQVWVHFFKRVL